MHLARRIPLVHTQCALKLRKPFLRIVAVGMLVKIGAPIGKVHIRGVRVEGVKKPVRLVCREGRLASLLGELALHRLDMVVADQALPAHLNVRGYSHFLDSMTAL